MIKMDIEVMDLFSPRLKEFGKRAPAIALRICRTIGQSFRAHVKKNYLRGQVIGKRSGRLYKSIKIVTDRKSKTGVIVKPWARLANIYHNPAGVNIVPKTAKVLRFETKDGRVVFTRRVHLEPRPWVGKSVSSFPWQPEIKKAADKVLDRELKKLEGKSGAR